MWWSDYTLTGIIWLMKKVVILVVALAICLGLIFWQFGAVIFQDRNKISEITVWSFAEDEAIFRAIANTYLTTHPKLKINVLRQSTVNYQARLSAQLKAGVGPDIFPLHSAWVSMDLDDLAPAPANLFPISEINKSYYPVIKELLVTSDKLYALPLEMDGLVLLYNEEIIKGANVVVPKTWGEFLEAARKVTVRDSAGQVVTSGAAMGTTTNVDYWPEILELLFFQQPNGDIKNPANRDGAEVLTFYTSFITDPKNKTWDTNLIPSTQMFLQGKLAFYFAPLKKLQEIKQLAPDLPVKVAQVPQLSAKNIGWAGFQTLAVSKRSPVQKEAWEFMKYLTSSGSLQQINLLRVQTGFFPRVYPFPEVAATQLNDPNLAPLVSQAGSLRGGLLSSAPGGSGVTVTLVEEYKKSINAVLQGTDPQSVLPSTAIEINKLLKK